MNYILYFILPTNRESNRPETVHAIVKENSSKILKEQRRIAISFWLLLSNINRII
jgi:hypothetical protein